MGKSKATTICYRKKKQDIVVDIYQCQPLSRLFDNLMQILKLKTAISNIM